MTKEECLKVITKVKLKPTVVDAFDALCLVENHVKNQEPFSLKETKDYIESLMPTKMGGVFIVVGKALRYLKNELYLQSKNKQ